LAALFLRVVFRFLVAAAFLPAVLLRAVVLFLVAAAFLPAATRLVDFRRAGLRAVDFFAALFLRAGLRAADFFAVLFLRVVVLFLVAAAFFPAADLFAAGLFRAAVFRAAIPVPLSSVDTKGPWVTTPSV
jgi:hypothetical protein